MKRTLAWIGIAAIIICFLALVYFTATGAPANVIMAFVFGMLVIPVIIHSFIILTKHFKNNNEQDSK